MYCPECGKELFENVKFCHQCGFNILKYLNETGNQGVIQETQGPDSPSVDPSAAISEEIHKESIEPKPIRHAEKESDKTGSFNNNYKIDIAAMIVLYIVTAGLYLPIFLYRRYEMFELRFGTKKIKKGAPIPSIVFYSFLLCTRFIMLFVDSYYHDTAYTTLMVFELIFWFFYLIFFYTGCYRIRSLLNGIAGTRTVSSVWTFLFNAFYLQYKMNRLLEWSDSPPSLPIFWKSVAQSGKAICSGCNKESGNYYLYYNKETDTYYHRDCAPEGVILRK